MDFKNTFFNSIKNKSKLSDRAVADDFLKDFYFFPKAAPSVNVLLTIPAGGKINFTTPVHYIFNPFPAHLLIYTISGSGAFSVNETVYTADTSHCLFFDCTNPFSFEHKGHNWKFYLFFISGNALSSYYELFQEVYDVLYPVPAGSSIPMLFSELAAMPSEPSLKDILLCNKKLHDIFTEMILSALEQSDPEKPVADYLVNMKEAFDNHYEQEYSLAYFEEFTGISRYRLCREFSAAFSSSPLQYLNQRRIEAAKELLLDSDMPVHEVGSAVGIDNTNHFIHLFKKFTGTTPFVFKQAVPASIRELRSPYKPGGLPPQ